MSATSRRLEGRVAIVTGASRGIGRAIAKRLAAEGAKIVINYLTGSKEADDLLHEIRGNGGEALIFAGDVSKSVDVKAMVEVTIAEFGKVDILVNNAGIIFRKKFLDSTEEEWDKTLDVNLKSVYLCSKEVAPIMIRQGKGKIVNISSVSGINGPPSALVTAAYAASKSGMIGLTRVLASSLAPTINVNVVAPGMVETEMLDSMSNEAKEARLEETPLKRFGRPEEIAAAVLYLASDESDFVTGETLVISGGRPLM